MKKKISAIELFNKEFKVLLEQYYAKAISENTKKALENKRLNLLKRGVAM